MKFKKSEAKEFIKNKKNFDKYVVHNFVNFCKANSLFYKDLEEAYDVFIVEDPIFHDCGLSMDTKKAYPIRLFYDDSGYHFLDDRCTSILNSYHFVFRFPSMKDALDYTKRHPIEKKNNTVIDVLSATLAKKEESSLKWWVLKTEDVHDGLYRCWCATFADKQIAYHNEQYYRETEAWEYIGCGPVTIHEIPKDFYEKYKEVRASECSSGKEAWLYRWDFSVVSYKKDKSKPAKEETKKEIELKEPKELKSTQDVIIDKIAELKAKSVISKELSDTLDLIVSYINTKADIDHDHYN